MSTFGSASMWNDARPRPSLGLIRSVRARLADVFNGVGRRPVQAHARRVVLPPDARVIEQVGQSLMLEAGENSLVLAGGIYQFHAGSG